MNAKRNKSGKLGKRIYVHKDRIKYVNEAFEKKKRELKLKGERLSYTLIASSYDSTRKQSCRKEVSAFFDGEPVSEELFKYICKYLGIPFATVADQPQRHEFLRIHDSRLGEMDFQRKSLDLTYKEIATRCNASESTIKRLFNDNAQIKKGTFKAVCTLLNKQWEIISSGRGTKNHNIPSSPKPFIVPRSQELDSISRIQKQHRFVLIHGQGGIGKTTLAAQYALKHKADYPGGVLWLRCRSGSTSIPSQIEQFLTEQLLVDRPQTSDTTERVKVLLRKWARREQPVLIIFDDLQSSEAIEDYLPSDDCGDVIKVIVTSRNRYLLDGMVVSLEIGSFSSEQGAEVLDKIFQSSKGKRFEEEHVNQEISSAVFNHPLAVVLIGHYFKQNIDAKVQLVLQQIRDVLSQIDDGETPRGELSVKATFDLTFNSPKFAPARKVALILSLFADMPIKWEFVESIFKVSSTSRQEKRNELFESYRNDFYKVSKKELSKIKKILLYGYHFIEFQESDWAYTIHPLIKDYLQIKEEESNTNTHRARFVIGMTAQLLQLNSQNSISMINKSHELGSYLLAHVNNAIDLTSEIMPSDLYENSTVIENQIYIQTQVAEQNSIVNNTDRAIELFKKAIELISHQHIEKQSTGIVLQKAQSLQRLGELYSRTDKKKSDAYFTQASQVFSSLSVDDFQTNEDGLNKEELMSAYITMRMEYSINLARHLNSQNNHDKALVVVSEQIDISKKMLIARNKSHELPIDESLIDRIVMYYITMPGFMGWMLYNSLDRVSLDCLTLLAMLFKVRFSIHLEKKQLKKAEEDIWKYVAIMDAIVEVQAGGRYLGSYNILDDLASGQILLAGLLKFKGKYQKALLIINKGKEKRAQILDDKDIVFVLFYVEEMSIKGICGDVNHVKDCWVKSTEIINIEINKTNQHIRNKIKDTLHSIQLEIRGLIFAIGNKSQLTKRLRDVRSVAHNILKEIEQFQEQIDGKASI